MKSFFLGTKKEREAKEIIEKLKDKDKKGSRKREQLLQAKQIRFRYLARLVVTSIMFLALTTVAFAGWYLKSAEEREYNHIKDIYTAGMDKIFRNIPDQTKIKEDDYALMRLSQLKQFAQNTGWATVDSTGSISSKTGGFTNGVWLAIVTDKKIAQGLPAPLSVSPENPNVLRIKSLEMTPDWAGIFLMHELSHIFDYLQGIEPVVGASPAQYLEGEARAFSVEIRVINLLSDNRFDKSLDNIIDTYKLQSFQQILSLNSPNQLQQLDAIEGILSMATGNHQPTNIHEDAMRRSVFLTAIAFSVAERQSPENDWQLKQEFLYNFYKDYM